MPSVLYVDDSHLGRTLARMTFARSGWCVIEATDGIAALAAITAHQPDCIVLSVPTPGLDALELMKGIRAIHSSAQIVVLTSRARSTTIDKYRERGAAAVIDKSTATAALEQILAGMAKTKNRAAA